MTTTRRVFLRSLAAASALVTLGCRIIPDPRKPVPVRPEMGGPTWEGKALRKVEWLEVKIEETRQLAGQLIAGTWRNEKRVYHYSYQAVGRLALPERGRQELFAVDRRPYPGRAELVAFVSPSDNRRLYLPLKCWGNRIPDLYVRA